MSFISELKRRNVIRVGAAYLVSAWLLIEIADILFPTFGFPRFALKLLITALGLALVPILMLAWAYELTTTGLVRDRGAGGESPENHNTGRRLDQVTIAMILLALAVVATERFVLPQRVAALPPALGPGTAAIVEPAKRADSGATAPRGSVAVLPFTNMSPDPENEYFADGISEELLNVLARVEGLKVASRTSAFSFKGKQVPVHEIARELNVAHVLEGSVRKQGVRVRITAQLIDAGTDQHLWSDTYDRELTDIFAVQEEIAQAISTALSRALGLARDAPEVEVAAPTKDLQAYELYLRGRQLFYQRGDALLAARRLLEDATARDPAFAEAWAVLSAARYVAPDYIRVSRAEATATALDAAEHALQLDDTLALPYAVLAQIADDRGELIEAARQFDQAIERDPRDSTSWLWRGIHHVRVGNLARAESDLQRAVTIDPLAAVTFGWLATVQGMRGDRDAAERGLQRAFDVGWSAAGWVHSRFALADGNRERAASDLRAYFGRFPDPSPSARRALDAAYATIADPAKGADFYAAVREDRTGINDAGWSATLAALGMHREAIAVELDETLPRGTYYLYRDIWFPTARGMLGEPEFLELAERDGLLAYWNAKGFPDGCRLADTPVRHLDCAERWR